MRNFAPLSHQPNAAFAKSQPSTDTLRKRPSWDDDELSLESEASTDSQVQAFPEPNPYLNKNLATIPAYRPGTEPPEPKSPLIQPKLTIGKPGDKYEQEADRTAARVMSMPDSALQKLVQREAMPEEEDELQMRPEASLQRESMEEDDDELQMKPESLIQRQGEEEDDELQMRAETSALQRQPEEEELQMKPESSIQRQGEEEDELQMKPEGAIQRQKIPPSPPSQEGKLALKGMPFQPKLSIGQPGDKYEQEADRTAAKVMAMPAPQRLIRGQESEFRTQNSESKIQNPKSKISLRPQIQAKGNTPEAPDNFESKLASHRGSGKPLSDETRAFMESCFGADFSTVRVHETPDLANAIQAQAFTHGQDIYFNSGKYNPGSSGGKELLAHELTHVVQQSGTNLVQANPEQQSPSTDSANKSSTAISLAKIKVRENDTHFDILLRALSSYFTISILEARQYSIDHKIQPKEPLPELKPGKILLVTLDSNIANNIQEESGRSGQVGPAISYNKCQKYSSQKISEIQEKVGLPAEEQDGIFGPKTVEAVKEWQVDNSLIPDGKVGPETYAKMFGLETRGDIHPENVPTWQEIKEAYQLDELNDSSELAQAERQLAELEKELT